jgi:ABC-type enterobactin transport system permease subunit
MSVISTAIAFVSIVVFKIDVTKLAAGAIVCGIVSAAIRALL